MSFNISITPHNIKFQSSKDSMLLDDALSNNINIPYGCKTGVCGACKCKLLSGEVVHDKYNSAVLNDRDLENNYILPCKARALSDLTLCVPELEKLKSARIFLSKIIEINHYGSVMVVKLKLPATQQFSFDPGQYIEIIHNSGSRFYSIANASLDKQEIELHIKLYANGLFSNQFWAKLQIGQLVKFKGPLGRFGLQETSADILMVCTGTGFAPVKSILEDMIKNNNKRKVGLVCGNYDPSDFYLSDLFEVWKEKLNIDITLCASQVCSDGYYYGRVTDYISNNFIDLKDYEIYACGSNSMIEDLYKISVNQLGLDKFNFFSDAFLAATA